VTPAITSAPRELWDEAPAIGAGLVSEPPLSLPITCSGGRLLLRATVSAGIFRASGLHGEQFDAEVTQPVEQPVQVGLVRSTVPSYHPAGSSAAGRTLGDITWPHEWIPVTVMGNRALRDPARHHPHPWRPGQPARPRTGGKRPRDPKILRIGDAKEAAVRRLLRCGAHGVDRRITADPSSPKERDMGKRRWLAAGSSLLAGRQRQPHPVGLRRERRHPHRAAQLTDATARQGRPGRDRQHLDTTSCPWPARPGGPGTRPRTPVEEDHAVVAVQGLRQLETILAGGGRRSGRGTYRPDEAVSPKPPFLALAASAVLHPVK